MVTDDIFVDNPGLYRRIHHLAQIEEKASIIGAHHISIVDCAQFDLELPPPTPRENSYFSNSSEKYSFAEGFSRIQHQYSVKSSSLNMSSPSVQTLCAHSTFAAYVKAGPIAAFESSTGGHVLHKRCFRFLISIQEKKGTAAKISGLNASASDSNNQHQKARTDSAFEHLIAERNRRTRLNFLKSLFSST